MIKFKIIFLKFLALCSIALASSSKSDYNDITNNQCWAGTFKYNVIYVDWMVSWNPRPFKQELKGIVDQNYNIVILSFLNAADLDNPTVVDALDVWVNVLTDDDREEVKDYYKSKGAKLMLSIGGDEDYIDGDDGVIANQKGAEYAKIGADMVLKYNLDGLDFDLELDNDNFWIEPDHTHDKFYSGEFQKFMTDGLVQARSQLPLGQYIISHAPQAPYFGNLASTNGTDDHGYTQWMLDNQDNPGVDFVNIQYYNQYAYYDYNAIFIKETDNWWFQETAVKQLYQAGVKPEKIVVGKPLTEDDGEGYIDPTSLGAWGCQAKKDINFLGGYMTWMYRGNEPKLSKEWSGNLTSLCPGEEVPSNLCSTNGSNDGDDDSDDENGDTIEAQCYAGTMKYNVIYVYWKISWGDGPAFMQELKNVVDYGYNIVNLAFLQAADLNNVIEDDALGQWINVLTNSQRNEVKNYYQKYGAKLLLSIGGESDKIDATGNVLQNREGSQYAQQAINRVQKYNLDGIDFDLILNPDLFWTEPRTDSFYSGEFQKFITDCLDTVREQLPISNYLVTFSMPASYLGRIASQENTNSDGYTGWMLDSYTDSNTGKTDQNQNRVNFLNIQYYDQDNYYTDYQNIFKKQTSQWNFAFSAVKEIMKAGVDPEKLVVGRPLTSADAEDDWVDPATLAEWGCKGNINWGFIGGYMSWMYRNDDVEAIHSNLAAH